MTESRILLRYREGGQLKVEGDPGLSFISTYVNGLLGIDRELRESFINTTNILKKPIMKVLRGGVFVPKTGKIVKFDYFKQLSRKESKLNEPAQILKIYHTYLDNPFIGIPSNLLDNVTYTVTPNGRCHFTYSSQPDENIPLNDLQKALNIYAQIICDRNPQCGTILPPSIIVEQLLVDLVKDSRRIKERIQANGTKKKS